MCFSIVSELEVSTITFPGAQSSPIIDAFLSAELKRIEEFGCRIVTQADPEYPELARRLNLKGIVRVQVTVAPGGAVKEVKELGGNPVLLDALIRAVRKWKYEPAEKESEYASTEWQSS